MQRTVSIPSPASTVVILPSDALLTPCAAPYLISNIDGEAVSANKRAYKKAYEDCRDQVQSIIDWANRRRVPLSGR